ncbi:MAG: hypothetical protein L3K01_00535 [Thermoplasmata archaeon]|nr:hypothetical protein [Thermoplasmata archaeon]MCI4329959.1 hypothetical protein [Thermoplasmata archaeon]MCI4332210.1 hypothetical protein [Thermoplasmata archaeon]
MTLERTEVVLSVEQEAAVPGQPPRRLRLEARFAVGSRPPSPAEIGDAIGQLDRELSEAARLAGFASTAPVRADRPVAELVETYRPRQSELVELLLAEGEISAGEAEGLRAYLGSPVAVGTPVIPPRDEVPVMDRPIAAAPLENDRSSGRARTVSELLSTYRIESLRQAGAVRARRQISFEEYMALKRHFGPSEPVPSPSGPENPVG